MARRASFEPERSHEGLQPSEADGTQDSPTGEPGDVAAGQQLDRRVAEVLRAIDTRFGEPDLSLRKLAREQHLSPWRLCHLLADAGVSFRQRLHETRCREAARLLRETPLLVKEVAAKVGYSSARQLSRHMKQHAGHSASKGRLVGCTLRA